MTEVHVRLSQLRETAAVFARASNQMRQSTGAVQDVIRELGLLGVLQGGAILPPAPEVGYTWADTLESFADSLSRAADDFERAVQVRLPHFDLSLLGAELSPELPPADQARPVSGASPLALGHYVSAANRPLYNELEREQSTLAVQRRTLAELQAERKRVTGNLEALRNQLRSFDPAADLQADPGIQDLQAQITTLDAQIAATSGAIDHLKNDIHGLTERLARVMPGPGADASLLRALETGGSPPWLVDNTFDCVRHVVSRMPVPPGIAHDAATWVQTATNHPEYGILSGNVPLPGSVVVMQPEHAYADDVYGHVMYVERVENGIAWITDNNHPTAPVPLSDLTSELAGPNITYLYFPWHTHA